MSMIKDVFSRVTAALQAQMAVINSFILQIQNLGTRAAQFVQQKIQRFIQAILKPPRSKKDYWRILGIYFSRRFVVIVGVVLGVIGYLFVYQVYPWAD